MPLPKWLQEIVDTGKDLYNLTRNQQGDLRSWPIFGREGQPDHCLKCHKPAILITQSPVVHRRLFWCENCQWGFSWIQDPQFRIRQAIESDEGFEVIRCADWSPDFESIWSFFKVEVVDTKTTLEDAQTLANTLNAEIVARFEVEVADPS